MTSKLVVAGMCGLLAACAEAKEYDVAAIVWPAYQPEPRWAELGIFGDGKGEWQNVYECKACAKPLWGYENEADPMVVARKIDAATAAGVNVFIYDWYWYEGRPFLQSALDEGFLKAPNRERMKFYIMYANHDVSPIWNNKVPDGPEKAKVIWPAKISEEDWKNIVRSLIGYFRMPNYYRIDGRPVFWLYRSNGFIEEEGLEKTQARLAYMREEVRKAGFPGLHLQVSASASRDYKIETIPEHIREVGADSVTLYTWIYQTYDRVYDKSLPRLTYGEWGELSLANMKRVDEAARSAGAMFIPNIAMGYDNRSRYPADANILGVVRRNPEEFESFARRVRDWTDRKTEKGKRKLIIVNAWNEWTEDSYLEPDDRFGYGYLNALWRVFGSGFGN